MGECNTWFKVLSFLVYNQCPREQQRVCFRSRRNRQESVTKWKKGKIKTPKLFHFYCHFIVHAKGLSRFRCFYCTPNTVIMKFTLLNKTATFVSSILKLDEKSNSMVCRNQFCFTQNGMVFGSDAKWKLLDSGKVGEVWSYCNFFWACLDRNKPV